jgi:hypothetical protein
MMNHSQRTLFWKRLDLPGSEYCTLAETDAGWAFESTVLLAREDGPVRVQYRLTCDPAWRTQSAVVTCMDGDGERSVRLAVDDGQGWRVDDRVRDDLRGCTDVDLVVTPATNTLPIRRLGLAVGESAAIAAAWITVPDLTITHSAQRYTRLAAQEYRYESDTYRTEIAVDAFGLVTHYPDGWERVSVVGR